MNDNVSDTDRYPTLTKKGRETLKMMREHRFAPIYRRQSGNRLTAADIEALAVFDQKLAQDFNQQDDMAWVGELLAYAYLHVPHYRALGFAPGALKHVPPISRADLAADIASFVPDDVTTDRMIQFQTTGTTGHPLLVPSHPQVAGRYLAFHKHALARFGITLEHGAGQIGVILLGYQSNCFTYTSVTPTMDESGLAKINLHPSDWHSPQHRGPYIDALAPEIIAGDPLSFEALLEIPVTCKPKALLSVSMMLTDGLRARLEETYQCPVLDLYSMNEVGPIGVFDRDFGGHVVLQPRLLIEILDSQLQPVKPGERGEIVVTGGFNFCLPLVRYRTGDYGALTIVKGERVIMGLAGRAPVQFVSATGKWYNNIDISHALKTLPTAQFGLHQNQDKTLILKLSSASMVYGEEAKRAILTVLGDLPMHVEEIVVGDKLLQYSTNITKTPH